MKKTCFVLLLLHVPTDTVAAQDSRTAWDQMCYNAHEPQPTMLSGYETCSMSLPDSIALTTSPRTDDFVGWFFEYGVAEDLLRVLYRMPTSEDTLMVAVVEAQCTKSGRLPMLVVRCGENTGVVHTDVEGALLTDSLVAAGMHDSFLKLRGADGVLVPARYVQTTNTDDLHPGIVPYAPPE